LVEAESLAARRKTFASVSDVLARVLADFPVHEAPLLRMRCPMAFNDRGADWLQVGREVRNPYFGSQMLRCGEVTNVFEPAAERPPGEPTHE
jgi:Cu(I)/Ag(I) efflux system membrane fusion protein